MFIIERIRLSSIKPIAKPNHRNLISIGVFMSNVERGTVIVNQTDRKSGIIVA